MNFNIKEIRDTKNKIVKSASKGIKYYIATIYIFVSIVIGAMFLGGLAQKSTTNSQISVTAEIFYTHGISASFCMVLLFVGLYLASKYVGKIDNNEQASETAKIITNDASISKKLEKEVHDKLISYRLSIASQVSNILKDLIISTDADKVCILEMHNGGTSMTGLPFLYADMNYEESKFPEMYTMEEYKNVNLNKYPLIYNHFNDGSWYGTIEHLQEEDQKLATKLNAIDVKYAVMMVVHGISRPIGFLQVYFKETPSSAREILSKTNTAAQKIAQLLDKQYIIENNKLHQIQS